MAEKLNARSPSPVDEIISVEEVAATKFTVCTGEFTEEEKQHLLKTGQLIEKDGEFLDISTLSESGFGDLDITASPAAIKVATQPEVDFSEDIDPVDITAGGSETLNVTFTLEEESDESFKSCETNSSNEKENTEQLGNIEEEIENQENEQSSMALGDVSINTSMFATPKGGSGIPTPYQTRSVTRKSVLGERDVSINSNFFATPPSTSPMKARLMAKSKLALGDVSINPSLFATPSPSTTAPVKLNTGRKSKASGLEDISINPAMFETPPPRHANCRVHQLQQSNAGLGDISINPTFFATPNPPPPSPASKKVGKKNKLSTGLGDISINPAMFATPPRSAVVAKQQSEKRKSVGGLGLGNISINPSLFATPPRSAVIVKQQKRQSVGGLGDISINPSLFATPPRPIRKFIQEKRQSAGLGDVSINPTFFATPNPPARSSIGNTVKKVEVAKKLSTGPGDISINPAMFATPPRSAAVTKLTKQQNDKRQSAGGLGDISINPSLFATPPRSIRNFIQEKRQSVGLGDVSLNPEMFATPLLNKNVAQIKNSKTTPRRSLGPALGDVSINGSFFATPPREVLMTNPELKDRKSMGRTLADITKEHNENLSQEQMFDETSEYDGIVLEILEKCAEADLITQENDAKRESEIGLTDISDVTKNVSVSILMNTTETTATTDDTSVIFETQEVEDVLPTQATPEKKETVEETPVKTAVEAFVFDTTSDNAQQDFELNCMTAAESGISESFRKEDKDSELNHRQEIPKNSRKMSFNLLSFDESINAHHNASVNLMKFDESNVDSQTENKENRTPASVHKKADASLNLMKLDDSFPISSQGSGTNEFEDTIDLMDKLLAAADAAEAQEANEDFVPETPVQSQMTVVTESPALMIMTPSPIIPLKSKRVLQLNKAKFFSPSPPRPKPTSSLFKAPTPRVKAPTPTTPTTTPNGSTNSPSSRKSLKNVQAKVDSGLRKSPSVSSLLGLESPVAEYIHAKAAPSPFRRVTGIPNKVMSAGKPAPQQQKLNATFIPRPSLPTPSFGLLSASKYNSQLSATTETSKFKQQQYTGAQKVVPINLSFAEKHQKENYVAQRHTGVRDEKINASIVHDAVVPKKFVQSRLATPKSYVR